MRIIKNNYGGKHLVDVSLRLLCLFQFPVNNATNFSNKGMRL